MISLTNSKTGHAAPSSGFHRARGQVFGALVALVLAGCSANHYAIYREVPTTPNHPSVIVDVKERFLLSFNRAPDKKGEESRQVLCAEPSPDALSTISSNLASEGSFSLVRPDQTKIDALLKLALTQAESGAFVGLRTQTIQLLRDGMFRLCEAYGGGALDSDGYARFQRKYINTMLALLAIEQLTGTVASRPVALTSANIAELGDALQVVQEKLADALKVKVDKDNAAAGAKSKVASADAAVKDAQAAIDKCGTCAEKQTLVAQLEDAKTKQTDAKTASDKAAVDAKTASAYADELASAAARAGNTLKAASAGQAVGNFGDLTDTNRTVMTAATAEVISRRVQNIVLSSFASTMVTEYCMEYLLRTKGQGRSESSTNADKDGVFGICNGALNVMLIAAGDGGAAATVAPGTTESVAATSGPSAGNGGSGTGRSGGGGAASGSGSGRSPASTGDAGMPRAAPPPRSDSPPVVVNQRAPLDYDKILNPLKLNPAK